MVFYGEIYIKFGLFGLQLLYDYLSKTKFLTQQILPKKQI